MQLAKVPYDKVAFLAMFEDCDFPIFGAGDEMDYFVGAMHQYAHTSFRNEHTACGLCYFFHSQYGFTDIVRFYTTSSHQSYLVISIIRNSQQMKAKYGGQADLELHGGWSMRRHQFCVDFLKAIGAPVDEHIKF